MSPWLVVLLCFPVAALGSMVGIGGGAFFVPLWLSTGVSFPEATALSLVLITAMGASASVVYVRQRLVDPLLVLALGPSAWIVGFLTGLSTGWLDPRALQVAFGVVLVPVAGLLFRELRPRASGSVLPTGGAHVTRQRDGQSYVVHVPGAVAAGALAGLLSGLFGIGGGMVVVPILTLAFRVPPRLAVATSTVLLAVTSAFGAAGHALAGHVPWGQAAAGAVVVVLGGQVGARVTSRLEPRLLRRLLGGVLLVIAALVELEALVGPRG